jgi:hypothetical protein
MSELPDALAHHSLNHENSQCNGYSLSDSRTFHSVAAFFRLSSVSCPFKRLSVNLLTLICSCFSLPKVTGIAPHHSFLICNSAGNTDHDTTEEQLW